MYRSRTAAPFFVLAALFVTPALATGAPAWSAQGAAQDALTPVEHAEVGGEPGQATNGTTGYKDGFFIRSADGRNEFVIEGLVQVLARHDGKREPRSDLVLKRFRPEFAGRIDGHYLFRLEPNFTEHAVKLEEAWAGAELWHGAAILRIGRMKAPFGLEEVRSRRHIDFPVFSILNQFSPPEDHRVFLYGETKRKALEWNVAVYNGTGGGDTGASKDVAGRLMWHPFADDEESAWQGLQLGLASTVGSQHESVAGGFVRNAAKLALTEYESGVQLDGTRSRLGLEAAWYRGPWMAQAEGLYLSQEMSAGAGAERVHYSGAYLGLSRVLTGESKDFGGVHPRRPVDPYEGTGRGAWVLAARLSYLEQDSALLDAGLVVPGSYTESVTSISLGLNWILSRHVMLRNSWIHSEYSDPVAVEGAAVDREDSFLIEFQLSF